MWAVPFGIVGGRLYHVITDPELYFTAGKQPIRALYIWDGGLGIWGAVALGAVGAWIGCRRRGIRLAGLRRRPGTRSGARAGHRPVGQLLQPGAVRRTHHAAVGVVDRPGEPARRTPRTSRCTTRRSCTSRCGTWVWWCCCCGRGNGSRSRDGRLFALYVAAYTVGRAWVEALRVDHANHFLGLRLNDLDLAGRLRRRGGVPDRAATPPRRPGPPASRLSGDPRRSDRTAPGNDPAAVRIVGWPGTVSGGGTPEPPGPRPLGGGSGTGFLREPARPAWVASRGGRRGWSFGTVCIGAFIGQLDASIVSPALPAIGADLGGSVGQVEWVALSYLLTLVAPIGRLADFGRPEASTPTVSRYSRWHATGAAWRRARPSVACCWRLGVGGCCSS